MRGLPKGSMVTVSLSEEELRSLLSETLSIVEIVNKDQCSVSGPINEIERLKRKDGGRRS